MNPIGDHVAKFTRHQAQIRMIEARNAEMRSAEPLDDSHCVTLSQLIEMGEKLILTHEREAEDATRALARDLTMMNSRLKAARSTPPSFRLPVVKAGAASLIPDSGSCLLRK